MNLQPYVFYVDITQYIRIITFMRYLSSKKTEITAPAAFIKPAALDEIFADSAKEPPEPISDLPDDDWDAWLAGAKVCPGIANAEGDYGA